MLWSIVIAAIVVGLVFLANRRYGRNVGAPHHRPTSGGTGNEYDSMGGGPPSGDDPSGG